MTTRFPTVEDRGRGRPARVFHGIFEGFVKVMLTTLLAVVGVVVSIEYSPCSQGLLVFVAFTPSSRDKATE